MLSRNIVILLKINVLFTSGKVGCSNYRYEINKKKLIFNTNEHNLDQSDQYILMAQAPICSSAF